MGQYLHNLPVVEQLAGVARLPMPPFLAPSSTVVCSQKNAWPYCSAPSMPLSKCDTIQEILVGFGLGNVYQLDYQLIGKSHEICEICVAKQLLDGFACALQPLLSLSARHAVFVLTLVRRGAVRGVALILESDEPGLQHEYVLCRVQSRRQKKSTNHSQHSY